MLEVAVSPHGLTTVVSGGFSTVLPTRLHCPESFHTPGLLPAHVSVGYRQQNAGLYPGLRPSQQRKNATSRRNYAYDYDGNRTSVTRNGVASAYSNDGDDEFLLGDGYSVSGYDSHGNPSTPGTPRHRRQLPV